MSTYPGVVIRLDGPCWEVRNDGQEQEAAYGPAVVDGNLHWRCEGGHGEHDEEVTGEMRGTDSLGERFLRCFRDGDKAITFYEIETLDPAYRAYVASHYLGLPAASSVADIEEVIIAKCGPTPL